MTKHKTERMALYNKVEASRHQALVAYYNRNASAEAMQHYCKLYEEFILSVNDLFKFDVGCK